MGTALLGIMLLLYVLPTTNAIMGGIIGGAMPSLNPVGPVSEASGEESPSADLLVQQAEDLMRQGRLSEASEIVRSALETQPEEATLLSLASTLSEDFLHEARKLKSERRLAEAYQHAREAQSLCPSCPETHWWVAWLAADGSIGDTEEAIQAFQRFRELSSDEGRITEAIQAVERLGDRE